MKLFLSPHNDDETLFGAFTIMREKPLVLIVTESVKQIPRGGLPTIRRAETILSMSRMGATVAFLGIPDNQLNEDNLVERLRPFAEMGGNGSIEAVYAPAWYMGGNPEHNTVSKAAERLFGGKVVYYSTYRANPDPDLEPKGDIEVVPTAEEAALKDECLEFYESQLALTPEHFAAVRGKSEWFVS